jgi:large subunit ribosomal protein L3
VTWGFRRRSTLPKPVLGHYAKASVEPGRELVELRLDDVADYAVGQELAADIWEAGERVDAIAVSKGKGFAGGMKRHNFSGQGASHGNHRSHRVPGAIGACATPSRVFKGTRMPGQLGGAQVTALNLEVVSADPERQLVLVKGAVPGSRGSTVVLRNSVKTPTKSGGAR